MKIHADGQTQRQT